MIHIIICYGPAASGKSTWIRNHGIYWFPLHDQSVTLNKFKKVAFNIDSVMAAFRGNATIAIECQDLERARGIIDFCEKVENIFVTYREFKRKENYENQS